ncbi:hypothetical protein [Neorhizobium sp. P12A]|uniref:hypothetical protein n=1 Tax=Neorhizobium sp. P12A TaxID=2268027 RepID=UPI001FEEFC88|nr:hypothetical protein [Neorhizobium sp. P12A]
MLTETETCGNARSSNDLFVELRLVNGVGRATKERLRWETSALSSAASTESPHTGTHRHVTQAKMTYNVMRHLRNSVVRNILLLEDQPFIALDLEEVLDENGHRNHVTFSTCAEAAAWLEVNKPSLAIVDPRLSDGVCTVVVRRLSELNIPFIVLLGRRRIPSSGGAGVCEWVGFGEARVAGRDSHSRDARTPSGLTAVVAARRKLEDTMEIITDWPLRGGNTNCLRPSSSVRISSVETPDSRLNESLSESFLC